MIFTEEEAKTKYCHNFRNSEKFTKNCLASDCMAWRVYSVTEEPTGNTLSYTLGPPSEGAEVIYEVKEVVRGYCGLAGYPHPPK